MIQIPPKLILLSAIFFAFLQSPIANADVPPLSVEGNRVLSGGKARSFAGNSFFWSNTGWGQERLYNAGVVKWLKDDWKSTIVRAAMGVAKSGGYIHDPLANKARVMAVVEAAIDNDMYVIIDFHSHSAHTVEAQSIAFFREMAKKYGAYNNTIYEIYNEPLNVSWSGVVKPYAERVIKAIREIDPDNLIVVGTPHWSQYVDHASLDPVTSSGNLAYALHFYAGNHGQALRDRATRAMNNGIALFVTEWGSVNAGGHGPVSTNETRKWMEYLKQNQISHVNWAVSDKVEGSSIIKSRANSNGQWKNSDLTTTGRFVRDIIVNWGTTIDSD